MRGTLACAVLISERGRGERASNSIGLENEMDVLKMLSDLRQEREQIEEAIVTLERLARGRGRRRGRPPAWLAAIKRRVRPPGSRNKAQKSTAASVAGLLAGAWGPRDKPPPTPHPPFEPPPPPA